MKLRRSPQLVRVLAEFLATRTEWRYGYDMSRATGLKSGTLYPILVRLAEHGLLATSWEANEDGRPPRHMYKLTRLGTQQAMDMVDSTAASGIRVPALGMAGE